jgi:hypothetical protein
LPSSEVYGRDLALQHVRRPTCPRAVGTSTGYYDLHGEYGGHAIRLFGRHRGAEPKIGSEPFGSSGPATRSYSSGSATPAGRRQTGRRAAPPLEPSGEEAWERAVGANLQAFDRKRDRWAF